MQPLPSRRAYTTKALEYWFDCLQDDWETHFTPEELEEGRAIYREGEIRAIELTDTEAIVYRRLEKSEDYAVIEWRENAPSVRFSKKDLPAGRAVAVAGILEIEELIADELIGTGTPKSATPEPSTPVPAPSGRPASGGKARALVLRFRSREDGLVFEAAWQNENGTRSPLQGFGPSDPGSHARNIEERKRMLNLTAFAKRARFRFSSQDHEYVLGDLRQIPEFLKRSLPEWKRQFTIEMTEGARTLAGGLKTVTFRASATSAQLPVAGGNGGGGGGLDLRWIFESGERLLTSSESAKLLAAPGAPILIPDIGLVSLVDEKAEQLRRMRSGLAELPEGAPLPHYIVFSLFQPDGSGIALSPEVERWKQSLMSAPSERPLPEFLRPYQRRGVEWMGHLCDHDCHGLLADEMGLGKTIQVLSLLASRPITDQPSLIVCPASVIPVWRDEIQRHFPHIQVEQLKGNRTFVDVQRPVVWISSYAQLRRQRPLLDVVEFGYAILDEAQFIKNPEAKVTAACFSIRARHRIALTGTPLENRQLDLWSLFRFLMPGFLGSRAVFEQALSTERDRTLARMRAQVRPFMLRRTKDEVASELPRKVQVTLACPLTDLQRVEYARICSEGLARLGPDLRTALRERSFGVFSLLTRLRQTCCDPALLPWVEDTAQNSGKISILLERLGEITAGGHKVVIFSQFVTLLRRIRLAAEAQLPGLPLFEITGATLDRRKPVQSFQEGKGAALMLVSLKAAGTGITLHAADYVFLMDPWWNPAVEEQAVDRVHRIGQTKTVFVYRLLSPGTIEERIQALQAGKRELFREVIDGHAPGEQLAEQFKTLEQLIQLGEVVAAE